jgi:hypothetical protein
MNKKLMLLAAGALTALAFAALPAIASAGEYNADCELGAGKTCTGSVAGINAVLTNTKNETVSCSNAGGTATQVGGTSTGTLELDFTGCKETTTIFKFSCNSAGKPAGTITTGPLVSHLVNLADPPATKTPGLLITNSNVTFECTGFAKKTVTGNILGDITNPQCGVFAASHAASFTQASNGHQTFKQVTGTGTIQDLISKNHPEGEYSTSSQTGTGTITWNAGNKVNITC